MHTQNRNRLAQAKRPRQVRGWLKALGLRGVGLGLVTLILSLLSLSDPRATAWGGLIIEFDYQYDSGGFFDEPERRLALEEAARVMNRYVDELAAIHPVGPESWGFFLFPPDGSEAKIVYDLTVPRDTIIVYPAGRQLNGRLAESLGIDGIGMDDVELNALVSQRGQVGAGTEPATDYSPVGGTISFDTDAPWHFDLDVAGLESHEFDFLTVAMHQLSAVLGFASSRSFNNQTNALGQFVGPQARAVGSSTNPDLELDEFNSWWRDDTESTWNGSPQKALFTLGIIPGERHFPTQLDRAGLRDVGWQEARPGDADLNGNFNSSDLITMFTTGKYEVDVIAGWSEGDFNDDAQFDSADLVAALQTGSYGHVAVAVPEPSTQGLLSMGWTLTAAFLLWRRRSV